MSEHNPLLGLSNRFNDQGPGGPPLGLVIEATCHRTSFSANSGLKHPPETGEETNNSKFHPNGTKDGSVDPFNMDDTYNNNSVPVSNPTVNHKQQVVKYLTDVSRAVIAAGNTTLGFGILKVTRDCLAKATTHLDPEQANLEALGHV